MDTFAEGDQRSCCRTKKAITKHIKFRETTLAFYLYAENDTD